MMDLWKWRKERERELDHVHYSYAAKCFQCLIRWRASWREKFGGGGICKVKSDVFTNRACFTTNTFFSVRFICK